MWSTVSALNALPYVSTKVHAAMATGQCLFKYTQVFAVTKYFGMCMGVGVAKCVKIESFKVKYNDKCTNALVY